jgi:hypothetical protein
VRLPVTIAAEINTATVVYTNVIGCIGYAIITTAVITIVTNISMVHCCMAHAHAATCTAEAATGTTNTGSAASPPGAAQAAGVGR